MRIERIESEGLAHYSYFLADGDEAIVIDPRLDVDIYIRLALKEGCRITQILETHRNEDYLVGSVRLGNRTGAEIWHADAQLEYTYGRPAEEGQSFQAGRLQLNAMRTPGHTPGSMSYVLSTDDGTPWMVFSGDTLLAGDVGRTDLQGPERIEASAAALHDSLFRKLLPLGDDVILCPAHGSESVCGGSISDRPWTTIGLERRLNSKLRLDRDDFIEATAVERSKPPYFKQMEAGNLEGITLPSRLPIPPPMEVREFEELSRELLVLDARDHLAFGACHIPGAVSIWRDGIPNYAGWLLEPDRPLLLVVDREDLERTAHYLLRMGYIEQPGYLSGGMLRWQEAGLETASVPMISTQDLCRKLDEGGDDAILDIRADEERASDGRLHRALTIPLEDLPGRLDDIPENRLLNIFCGSGLRSMAAASLLLRSERDFEPRVVLGGAAGWKSARCPIEL
jgi:hydroxyacylglutathione hydrolase